MTDWFVLYVNAKLYVKGELLALTVYSSNSICMVFYLLT